MRPTRQAIHLHAPTLADRAGLSIQLEARGYEVLQHDDLDALGRLRDRFPAVLDRRGEWGAFSQAERLVLHSRPTIVTATAASVAVAVQAMQAGAAYFLGQPWRADQLSAALGACALDADNAVSALNDDGRERLFALSPRQRQVLEGVVRGETGKAIGLRLGISPRTVEAHRAIIRRRLGARGLPHLIALLETPAPGAPTQDELALK